MINFECFNKRKSISILMLNRSGYGMYLLFIYLFQRIFKYDFFRQFLAFVLPIHYWNALMNMMILLKFLSHKLLLILYFLISFFCDFLNFISIMWEDESFSEHICFGWDKMNSILVIVNLWNEIVIIVLGI